MADYNTSLAQIATILQGTMIIFAKDEYVFIFYFDVIQCNMGVSRVKLRKDHFLSVLRRPLRGEEFGGYCRDMDWQVSACGVMRRGLKKVGQGFRAGILAAGTKIFTGRAIRGKDMSVLFVGG